MKLRHLEAALSDVDRFENPKIELEQIPTSPHIAARMIFTASSMGDIVNCNVADFGCGPGILTIASKMLGSAYNVGFDVDAEALDNAWVNLHKLEITDVDLVQADVPSLQFEGGFDTIIMNPPFGTRNAGIDTAFVKTGMNNANVVYSLHKTSTREHFVRLALENDYHLEVLAQMKYALPNVFKFHKQKSKDIEVDLYRFTHKR